MSTPGPVAPLGVYCTACGHFNPAVLRECELCKTKLVVLANTASASPRQRPGCVTAHVILLCFGIGLIGLIGLISISSIMGPSGTGLSDITQGSYFVPFVFLLCFIGGFASLDLLIVWGLWRLKNWARILVIALHSLGVLGNFISACTGLSSRSNNLNLTGYPTYPEVTIITSIVGLVIGGVIIAWYANNGEYFN